ALGGHSFTAIALAARIARSFDSEVTVRHVFMNPTVELMACLLRSQGCLGQSSLVPIQPQGSRLPLFCIHPAGGSATCYITLARCLGTDQPLYGLQSRGVGGVSTPLTSIEDMAALYLDEIRSIQPTGPYQLAGWSLGAIIAYEIAQRLVQAGQEISLL